MSYSSLLKIRSQDMRSEAEVETRLLAPLFRDLGYQTTSIIPKASVPPLVIKSGRASHGVTPDFLLLDVEGKVRVIVEAKEPSTPITSAWGQAAGYALTHNAKLSKQDRASWLLISNGHVTSLYPHDSAMPAITLRLADLNSGSPPYVQLRSILRPDRVGSPTSETSPGFDAVAPAALNKLFQQSHDMIWKKQKLSPTDAFFEFCKFIFLKIREDKKREAEVSNGRNASFPLTSEWLNEQRLTSKHPVRALFDGLRAELEDEVTRRHKKRIFETAESLRLSADVCRELVKRFEGINLSSIDEDLNGRMFEVFLNQAVRGKELGQYFTPRPLVEFMTRVSLHKYEGSSIYPKTIDACCGTAGFLIEAMAFLESFVRNDSRLTPNEAAQAQSKIKNQLLFGIEGNERVARVARINMYLHGDGGSHIFHGDGLDSAPQLSDDMTAERSDEVKDHALKVLESSFDLALSNPPFSMSYESGEPDEARILAQLRAWTHDDAFSDAEITAQLDDASKIKSNLLFMIRYHRLLKTGGELFIVIDDTILNGESLQFFRQWLMDHFVILSIHSLPFNAFFKAKANIKTSSIHLRKKNSKDEVQGNVFMSISNNIGHDNALRDTPSRNNLNDILNAWFDWRQTGLCTTLIKHNEDKEETLECPEQIWLQPANTINADRLDAFAFAAELANLRETLRKNADRGEIHLAHGRDFAVRSRMTKEERKDLTETGEVLTYIEISDVTRYGLVTSYIRGIWDELPTRGQIRLKQGDVLVAINNSSRGTVAVVPKRFDGAICTTGFLVLNPKDEEEGLLLWYSLRSEAVRKQFYYLAQTASQPELKRDAWNSQVLIPMPIGEARIKALEEARSFLQGLENLGDADGVRMPF